MAKDDGAKPEEDKLLPRLRRKYGWLDHLIRANDAFTERYGNHYAAAITYFSVLSVIPILMVAFAIIGIVLRGDTSVTNQLVDGITKSVPDGLRGLVGEIIGAALKSGGGIGVFGLLLALYSGVGWMSNLRDALTAQWGQEKQKLPLVSTTIKDLLSLVGLGLALVVSFGLTAAGSGVGRFLLELVGLENQGWAVFLLKVATILLGLLANTLVFLWVIARLPREHVALRSAVKGAIFAAVGFIVLQQAATLYLGSVTKSPAFTLFGPVIGLLVFANLVSRFLLFVTAWTATAKENQQTVVEPPAPVLIHPRVTVQQGPGLGAVGGAFATGALLGWFGRRKS
ncbi:YhjD/YihY/BrkB family envelope integrity protein [Amycolatopsis sp. EV170708-02-1]|uniref:YhjD/YihY/BrkB family envelope integrity protein n=1 Tax=Amycolatopsis sp. EV170708-02-1 TaxID=2919322 RepID=UPI001F0C7731|nr:YhjD/YihY/BrkB family envelope integrity protein [Amycolatopsis sp. EV170708-02-1]UMP02008.1 YihY/virulence factor BrkB family protein [Amycolatopsis sp. EV170708-02-1]